MTCAQGLLRLLWGGSKLECYGTVCMNMVISDGNPQAEPLAPMQPFVLHKQQDAAIVEW